MIMNSYNDIKKYYEERKAKAVKYYQDAKQCYVEYLEKAINKFLKGYGDKVVIEFCPVSDNDIDENKITCIAVRSGYDKEPVFIGGTELAMDTSRKDKYYVCRAKELLSLLVDRLNKEDYNDKKSLIYNINMIIDKLNEQREIALNSIKVFDKNIKDELSKAVYIGLENVLVIISAFNNSTGVLKPAFTFKSIDNSMRYVYVRQDIKLLRGIKLGVVSELRREELMQVVSFLNDKYKLSIVDEFSDNAKDFKRGSNNNIILADYTDAEGNRNYRARINNLKIAGSEFAEVQIFSDLQNTSKGSGLTMRQLKNFIKKQAAGFSNEN